MTKRFWIGYAGAAAFAAASLAAPAPFADARERLRDRMMQRMGADEGPKAPGSETIAYGRDYDDVSPISGILLGGSEHSVHVGVDVVPIA